jgi:phosphoribosylaminoimidazole-succinocarboxamide synthase
MTNSSLQGRKAYADNGLELIHRGKVRDTYQASDPQYLIVVATDRVSTHNVVHLNDVPRKGEVLTALTLYWADLLMQKHEHHIIACGQKIKDFMPSFVSVDPSFWNRAILVRKLEMIPVEFIFRGYMTGSLWKSYSKGEPDPYGLALPEGLQEMSKLDQLIFTPTDKSEDDDPLVSTDVIIDYTDASNQCALLYLYIRAKLNRVGIEMIDSKFEVGESPHCSGLPIIADEFGTPDSSRFCELSEIQEGSTPTWLDKQVLRDEAEMFWNGGKKAPVQFSSEAIERTTKLYLNIFERITGKSLDEFQKVYM